MYCRCPLFAGNGDDIIIYNNNKWIFFISCYQNVIDILFLEKRKTTQELVISGVNLCIINIISFVKARKMFSGLQRDSNPWPLR